MGLTEIAGERLSKIKRAYTTRRVPLERIHGLRTDRAHHLSPGSESPRAGDLVLARVERLGQHPRLELGTGRRAHMYCGDEILLCYGNRYAPDQFEAEVPSDLGPCDLVAAGGVAARMLCRHAEMSEPTKIVPLGLVCDAEGERLNLADWALTAEDAAPARSRRTLAVTGTSMNSGKTHTAVSLVRGLSAAGLRVGVAKITGTGSGGDCWRLADAGAWEVLDFTDAGLVSTYRVSPDVVLQASRLLRARLVAGGADVVVLEIADGLYQCETAALLRSPELAAQVDHFVFAAADALGAVAGVGALRELGLPVAAVSGLMTASSLATREAQQAVDVPVMRADQLADPAQLQRLDLAPSERAAFAETTSATAEARAGLVLAGQPAGFEGPETAPAPAAA